MKCIDFLKSTFLYCWLSILSIIISTEKNYHFVSYKWVNQWWKNHIKFEIFKIKIMTDTITLEDSLTFTYKSKHTLNHTIQQSHSLLFNQINWKHIHTKTCMQMFIAALFLIAKTSQVKEPTCQCRRHKRCGFDLWVGKIPWRRAWQPTRVFSSGESHCQRRLTGYSS